LVDRGFVSAFPPYDELGIKLIENTAEEICDVVMEMVDMLRPERPNRTDEEINMQNAFWSIYRHNLQRYDLRYLHGDLRARVGAKFLADALEFTDDIIDPTIYRLRP
jgi:hypothetical protein